MREILFRGKDVNGTPEWRTGYFCTLVQGSLKVIGNGVDWCQVYSETVGQYTGLTDKNGTKIFEGDILKGLYANGNAEVRMINGSWVGYAGKGWTDIGYVVDRVEVIGNIHDNPELLTE